MSDEHAREPLTEPELQQLARALCERDALADTEAQRVARSIAAMDPAIREIARVWMRTGAMPAKPTLWGQSPASVADLSKNTPEAFSFLHGLTEELPGLTIALLDKRRDERST